MEKGDQDEVKVVINDPGGAEKKVLNLKIDSLFLLTLFL